MSKLFYSFKYLLILAMVVSATRTDSSSGKSWIPLGNLKFSIITVTSLVSVSYSSTLKRQRCFIKTNNFHSIISHSQTMLEDIAGKRKSPENSFMPYLPSICCGFHDQLHEVSALPPAAGVSEVHLLPILSNVQVIHKAQASTSDHPPCAQ